MNYVAEEDIRDLNRIVVKLCGRVGHDWITLDGTRGQGHCGRHKADGDDHYTLCDTCKERKCCA